jgi:zinc transporter ZupT
VSATYTAVILLSLLSCLTTSIGVALALWLRENARAIAAGIGFSAGIMILTSVLDSFRRRLQAWASARRWAVHAWALRWFGPLTSSSRTRTCWKRRAHGRRLGSAASQSARA